MQGLVSEMGVQGLGVLQGPGRQTSDDGAYVWGARGGGRGADGAAVLGGSWYSEHSKHVLSPFNFKLNGRCKAVRPKRSVGLEKILSESGTGLITILRCFLSFKTVV